MNTNNRERFIGERIAKLQKIKGVSDRKISLDIGCSEAYMHNIVSGRSLLSLPKLFAVCDYFGIKLKDFFDDDLFNRTQSPLKQIEVIDIVKTLDEDKLDALLILLKGMGKDKNNED